MRRLVYCLIFLMSGATISLADNITVVNDTSETIYKMYAWPTDLIARSYNVLGGLPLGSKSRRTLLVDNSYKHCFFTFQFDLNNPRDMKRRNYRRKRLSFMQTDICRAKGVVTLK